MAACPADITELYAPQFEQFGLSLDERGATFTGSVDNDVGSGRAWLTPLSDSCLVLEHAITPKSDMLLLERTPSPYACASLVNESTLVCMPESGISPTNVRVAPGENDTSTTCSFVRKNSDENLSPLRAGHLYRSRSVIFLPRYFDELERSYPGEYSGLFDSFARGWGEQAQLAMGGALRRISERRAQGPAGRLYLRGVVETMVAELACANASGELAARATGSRESERLVLLVRALVERGLDEGRAMGVDELATRLYVSRSKLCATFSAETGEGVAAYVRRRRIERAEKLLAEGRLSMGQVAKQLGYPRASAFSQAFRAARGISPSVWQQFNG